MKKIALLLTIVCVQLYGMESTFVKTTADKPKPGRYVGMDNLPQEIQAIIVSSLHTYDNPDELIHAIKVISRTNTTLRKIIFARYGDFSNLQQFTALVYILANKFHIGTKEIADKFNTPTSKQYVELGEKLRRAVYESKNTNDYIDEITKLLEQGADVNYFRQFNGMTALHQAVMNLNQKMVHVLLNHGASQNLKYFSQTPLEWVQKIYQCQPHNYKAEEILEMLKEATKKPQ
jgi:hypothetical protein